MCAKKILLVDDDEKVRTILKETLQMDGYEVVDVKDGESALQEALYHPFAVMILDLTLPDITGQSIMATLSLRKFAQNVLIITGSSITERQLKSELKNGGAKFLRGFMAKPIRREPFLAEVKRIADSAYDSA
jgi:DNA-binding response OmpR family regulator